jgi:putative tryptophan/tyrosine transport system substrate-binding protein
VTSRRNFLLVVSTGALTAPSWAQPPAKVPHIGFLSTQTPATLAARLKVLREALRELGYAEGKNIHIEHRYAEGNVARLPDLASELLRLRPHLIVATSTPAVQAILKHTSTVPILMTGTADPVATGFVASLAKPGRNVTGLSLMAPQLAGKRLQLMKEVIPALARVAFLAHGGDPAHRLFIKEAEGAAAAFGVRVEPVIINGPDQFEEAFSTMARARVDALIVQPLFGPDSRIIALAAKHRLPAVSDADRFADAGGLIYYGPDRFALYRSLAAYIDKILKGAKPADLPVEQPTKFSLVVNMKAAKALGIAIPQSILLQAERVVE